jgi:hypothetical protein
MRGALTNVQLLDLAIRLEDDPLRRHELDRGWAFFQAAVAEGLVDRMAIEGFAVSVGNAINKEYLDFGSQNGGQVLPPVSAPWTSVALQARHDYEPTLKGRHLIETARNTRSVPLRPETNSTPTMTQARQRLRDGARTDAIVVAVDEVLKPFLFQLASEHGVPSTTPRGRATRLANLNDLLRKAGVYGMGDHDRVSAWLHDRNDLAHARGEHISDDRLAQTLDGIEVFVRDTSNVPAPSTP